MEGREGMVLLYFVKNSSKNNTRTQFLNPLELYGGF